MTKDILLKHREVWKQKKILREIYEDWYRMIISDLSEVEGPTVELGAGGGNFKEYYPKAISADIEKRDWLDMSFDAHEMPFEDGSIANIVMIDVLHHLADPLAFLNEASRVLASGGRLLMLEPYPSPFSRIIYSLFHPEPFIYDVDYFSMNARREKDPWDSNQAVPYLIFHKLADKFEERFGNRLRIRKRELLSMLAYPLSGGFENRPLISESIIRSIMKFENSMSLLRRFMAFRTYIVLERQ